MPTILFDAFAKSDLSGKLILLLLMGLSVYSWGVLITEYLKFRLAGQSNRRFLRLFKAAEADPLELYTSGSVGDEEEAPILRVYNAGCRCVCGFLRESSVDGGRRLATKELLDVEDTMTMAINGQALEMEMRLGALATISSVSPLLGLFGTVWGIMLAFHSMGVHGTTSIRAVAPGLTVALVTTVSGLAVAIPALVGHNILAAQVRLAVSRMKGFALDFLGRVDQAGLPEKKSV